MNTEEYPQLFINLAVVFLTSACCQMLADDAQLAAVNDLMKKLPAKLSLESEKLLYEEFLKSLNSLKKVKQTINPEERQLRLVKIRMICMLTQKYNNDHKESDVSSMALILK